MRLQPCHAAVQHLRLGLQGGRSARQQRPAGRQTSTSVTTTSGGSWQGRACIPSFGAVIAIVIVCRSGIIPPACVRIALDTGAR